MPAVVDPSASSTSGAAKSTSEGAQAISWAASPDIPAANHQSQVKKENVRPEVPMPMIVEAPLGDRRQNSHLHVENDEPLGDLPDRGAPDHRKGNESVNKKPGISVNQQVARDTELVHRERVSARHAPSPDMGHDIEASGGWYSPGEPLRRETSRREETH